MLFPHVMRKFYMTLETKFREQGWIAGKSGRHMKFPYTLSAKIAQFPFFYYFRNNWVWMYYPPGWVVGAYFISYIHAIVNSDANKANWAEIQRKNAEKEHH